MLLYTYFLTAESHKDRCRDSIGILVFQFLKKMSFTNWMMVRAFLCVLHTFTYTNFKTPPSPLLSLRLFSIVSHFAFCFCNAHSSQRCQVSCAMMLLRCLWWMVVTVFSCLLLHFILMRFVVLCCCLYCLLSFAVYVGSRTEGDLVQRGTSYRRGSCTEGDLVQRDLVQRYLTSKGGNTNFENNY